MKYYFPEEINQRKSCSKLSKYVAVFDNIDQILIVLIAETGAVSICSFTSIVETPVGIATESFTLIISLTTRITKMGIRKNKHEKRKRKSMIKILMLAKRKLNSTETLI